MENGQTKENYSRKHSYEYDFQGILCITRTWIITAKEKSFFFRLLLPFQQGIQLGGTG